MKKPIYRVLLLTLVLVMLTAGVASAAVEDTAVTSPADANTRWPFGNIVVANRASGTASVIDVATDQVSMTLSLPGGDAAAEPMYVVYTLAGNRVFIGDRANDRVVVYDADDFSYETSVDAGAGVFHMWANPQNTQLWVNNDIDNTSTVIDPATLQVVATVPMPADLVAMGGKPHDVVLDLDYAYVTMLGFPGENDYVVKFSQSTFQEVDRAPVGKDPHVSLTLRNSYLYVPSQNSNALLVLDRGTLNQVDSLDIPGAHGAGMTWRGRHFYTTNLTGEGTDALWTINTRTNTVVGDAVDTPVAIPHNIALTADDGRLYVTHSGATNNTVTVYDTNRPWSPVPVYAGTITVGNNPFGLAFVP